MSAWTGWRRSRRGGGEPGDMPVVFDTGFRPDTPAKAMQTLESIARYGSRDAFIHASEPEIWLAHEPDRAPASVLPTKSAGRILPDGNR
jgi:hypothetical protein